MAAADISRELRSKYERIMRDGREQYMLAMPAVRAAPRLIHLQSAQVHFAQAWMVADIAVQVAPANQYTRWCDLRIEAGRDKHTCSAALDRIVAAIGDTEPQGE